MNPTISDRLLSVIQTLHDTGHIEDSCSDDIPKAIRIGHPVRRAVKRLRECYLGQRLPLHGRRDWQRLRRLSKQRSHEVFEAAVTFLLWLEAEHERLDGPIQDEQSDGLIELGCQIKWAGRVFDLQPQTWRILRFFWDKTQVSQADFEDEFWDGFAESQTVRKAIHRANQALQNADVNWRLRSRNAHVLKVLPTGGDSRETEMVTSASL
jgi:hypothetical protein